jgi:hypothetical protein
VAGVGGGIIMDPEENLENSFPWGIGRASNNQAKDYTLYHGILLAKKNNLNTLIIIRDSSIIITLILSKTIPSDRKLASIVARV